jgi:hypothetical protein
MDRHSELEHKFLAGHVNPADFDAFCLNANPIGYKTLAFPDVYYRRGDNVVRHRLLTGAGELTVKRRKSAESITDRKEVDLRFAPGTEARDVSEFLLMAGWEVEFILLKHFSRVWWFKHGDATLSVSLYEVERQDTKDTRRFLEIEVEKVSPVEPEAASNLLALWSSIIAEEFDLADPQTESLYETYSGRRYLSV